MKGESFPLDNGLALRAALEADLDDITRIHRDGFVEEPAINYMFPFRDQHADDFWTCTREEYEHYLKQPDKWRLQVVEAPVYVDGEIIMRVAGLAVWDLAVNTKDDDTGLDLGLGGRKDANKKHCKAFLETAGQRSERYFAKWGERRVHLSVLVVEPVFRRLGVGTMLVNWGIDTAKGRGVPVTLCASPMGELLYKHLEFEKIATEVVRIDGEEESVASAVMVYHTKSTEDGQAASKE